MTALKYEIKAKVTKFHVNNDDMAKDTKITYVNRVNRRPIPVTCKKQLFQHTSVLTGRILVSFYRKMTSEKNLHIQFHLKKREDTQFAFL